MTSANHRDAFSPPLVLVLEDDDDYRESLRIVIEAAGLDVALFRSAGELLQQFDANRPGCLVMDLQTPGTDAITLYETLINRGCIHPFLVISAHGTVPEVAKAMRNGAVDFLAKPVEHGLLVQRISEAIKVDQTRRESMRQKSDVTQRLSELSPREREVMALVAEGLASKQIAKRMEIGTSTVDVHRSNLMKKMDVDSIVQLVRLLSDHDALPPSSATDQA